VTTARVAARAARLEAAMSAAVTQVTAALPMIGAEEAAAALEAAVPVTTKGQGPAWFLEELAAHITAHPDALTSGSSLCPLVLLRLARVLHEAGYLVVRPGWRTAGRSPTVCGSCAMKGGSAAAALPARGRTGRAGAAVPSGC
jgi:hypothetical protein